MRRGNGERASLRFLVPLITYVKKHVLLFALAVFCAVGGTVFTIIGPSQISRIADLITAGLMLYFLIRKEKFRLVQEHL